MSEKILGITAERLTEIRACIDEAISENIACYPTDAYELRYILDAAQSYSHKIDAGYLKGLLKSGCECVFAGQIPFKDCPAYMNYLRKMEKEE